MVELVETRTLEGMSSLTTSRRGRTGLGPAALSMALVVAAMWVLEAVDQASGSRLDLYGIHPRSEQGLLEIFTAPWLHGGWAHLVSNTVPFFVLGVVVLLDGWQRWLAATAWVVVVSGLFVWVLTPPTTITLGASGIVFGWLTYLVVRGIFTRAPGQVALGVVVFFLYGGILLGVLPGTPGISWQAHLGGAVGGVIAARGLRHRPVDQRWH